MTCQYRIKESRVRSESESPSRLPSWGLEDGKTQWRYRRQVRIEVSGEPAIVFFYNPY